MNQSEIKNNVGKEVTICPILTKNFDKGIRFYIGQKHRCYNIASEIIYVTKEGNIHETVEYNSKIKLVEERIDISPIDDMLESYGLGNK